MLKNALLPGAAAGLVGGLLFGAAMSQLGLLPTIALLVRADSALAGFLVHLAIAVLVGAGFGWLVWRQRPGAGETLFWGLAYGLAWWVIGPLTLLPLLLGRPVTWEVHAAQDAFPSLLGHFIYGSGTGLVMAALRRGPAGGAWSGPLLRGAVAGLLAAWLLGLMLDAQGHLAGMGAMLGDTLRDSRPAAWLITLLIGLLAGLGYAWLYPRPFGAAGAGLVRGVVYGFFWWIAGARTLIPLLNGDGLAWSLAATRTDFPSLPGFLLFGAAVALLYQWFHRLVEFLLAEDVGRYHHEGAGTQGLRALGQGAAAGLVGGLLFTVVMVQIGFLPTVARLVGAVSPLAGFIVHLAIAALIGMSYGLLFRRQSYDLGSAVGWGVSYGFVWWVLGPLTLLPALLGSTPQWSVAAAAEAFPAVVGHLAYGAGLSVVFYRLEAAGRPWWVSRSQAEAARIARRREQILTSAPALWVLVVAIALTLPILLGM